MSIKSLFSLLLAAFCLISLPTYSAPPVKGAIEFWKKTIAIWEETYPGNTPIDAELAKNSSLAALVKKFSEWKDGQGQPLSLLGSKKALIQAYADDFAKYPTAQATNPLEAFAGENFNYMVVKENWRPQLVGKGKLSTFTEEAIDFTKAYADWDLVEVLGIWAYEADAVPHKDSADEFERFLAEKREQLLGNKAALYQIPERQQQILRGFPIDAVKLPSQEFQEVVKSRYSYIAEKARASQAKKSKRADLQAEIILKFVHEYYSNEEHAHLKDDMMGNYILRLIKNLGGIDVFLYTREKAISNDLNAWKRFIAAEFPNALLSPKLDFQFSKTEKAADVIPEVVIPEIPVPSQSEVDRLKEKLLRDTKPSEPTIDAQRIFGDVPTSKVQLDRSDDPLTDIAALKGGGSMVRALNKEKVWKRLIRLQVVAVWIENHRRLPDPKSKDPLENLVSEWKAYLALREPESLAYLPSTVRALIEKGENYFPKGDRVKPYSFEQGKATAALIAKRLAGEGSYEPDEEEVQFRREDEEAALRILKAQKPGFLQLPPENPVEALIQSFAAHSCGAVTKETFDQAI